MESTKGRYEEMNKVLLIGRLVADPEVKTTNNGRMVASYRLAVDRQFKQDGQPNADFLSCVVWGKGAEFASVYLHKGIRIAIEGRIQVRSYDSSDGRKVYVTEIIVEHQEFCESKSAASNNAAAPIAPRATQAEREEVFAYAENNNFNDDNVPF